MVKYLTFDDFLKHGSLSELIEGRDIRRKIVRDVGFPGPHRNVNERVADLIDEEIQQRQAREAGQELIR